jgi:hypothetical protein
MLAEQILLNGLATKHADIGRDFRMGTLLHDSEAPKEK